MQWGNGLETDRVQWGVERDGLGYSRGNGLETDGVHVGSRLETDRVWWGNGLETDWGAVGEWIRDRLVCNEWTRDGLIRSGGGQRADYGRNPRVIGEQRGRIRQKLGCGKRKKPAAKHRGCQRKSMPLSGHAAEPSVQNSGGTAPSGGLGTHRNC